MHQDHCNQTQKKPNQTLTLISNSNPGGVLCYVCLLQEMDNAPDLMDDTFLLAGRAAAYAPRMLLHETLLPLLLDTAMVSVSAHLSVSA